MYLVGLAEAAEIMGESKKKISVYRGRNKFPKPIQELASGPIWTRNQIVHYKYYKDSKMVIYYNDGRMWELSFDEPMKLCEWTLDEFMKKITSSTSKISYAILSKEQVDSLKASIKDPNLVQQLIPGNVALHYNFGLITDNEYNEYLELLKTAPHALNLVYEMSQHDDIDFNGQYS
ncbi:hypothetical protein M5X06_22260 [Paenibacillus alvei]|uniref:Uncharacterized protein n=1 Tax=Paenibacillus alvei TaxID=44250 RepID=A0ABT4H3E1_PAEAL|nr:hypothetical protein [Paenibacillus alvei]MCY9763197.1 hypothetical protein [Paenibacillus alvei]MCY9769514.1 hypothetical protein [Paenibacillus alvei]